MEVSLGQQPLCSNKWATPIAAHSMGIKQERAAPRRNSIVESVM